MIPPFRPLQKDTHACSSPNLTSQPHSLLINNDLYTNEIMLIKQKHSMVVTLNGSVQTPDLFQGTFYLKRYLKQAALNRFLLHVLVNRGLCVCFFLPPGRELPPICSDVRQKHRLSIDTLPPEVKAPFPSDPILPPRTKTTKEFQEDMERAVQSGDWREVREFYLTTFDSFIEINAAFKREANGSFNTIDDSGVNAKFVNAVYDALLSTPQDIQKSVLKGIINSLLREWKGVCVCNPQYSSTSTYVIYAHLLRQIAALSEADHHFLVHWLKKLSARRFRQPVERLLQFISTRLFPAEPDELPPLAKCSWWIPSATKVLGLFNAANSVSSAPIMPFTDFYNITLEHIDFMEEYRTWQNYGNSNRFSFCQFPFILSTVVKKAIIQKDSEQQMISQARQSLVSKVSRRQRVDMNLLFLNIKVRRAQLLSDSLDELTRKRCDLKKKLRVTFVGEAGLDMGGLTKEWFLLLVRQIFHTDYGMFTYMRDSRCHWFSSWKCDNYSEFQLVGTVSFSRACSRLLV
uniref:HECT-type E3 ubiquitin transferase n=1 Tax=Gasterosteus aculeatus aculeatus TaxID=481459 RepID=A0AAQ4P8I7_GASAC